MMVTKNQPYLHNSLSLKTFILSSGVILFVGQWAVYPFANTMSSAILIPVLSLVFFFIARVYGLFFFGCMMYLVSCFEYGNNQGGVWNYCIVITSVMITIDRILQKNHGMKGLLHSSHSSVDWVVETGLISIVIVQCIGWLTHQYSPRVDVLRGAVLFLPYLYLFRIMQNQTLGIVHVGFFYTIVGIVVVYMLPIGLLHAQDIYFRSPLLGGTYDPDTFNRVSENIAARPSIMRNTELYAEFNLMSLLFYLPVLLSSYVRKNLQLNSIVCIIVAFCSIGNLILAGSRSCMILAIVLVPLYCSIFIATTKGKKIVLAIKASLFLGIAVCIVAVIISYLPTAQRIVNKFNSINFHSVSPKTILSGESINRGPLFAYGIQRLTQEQWFIGYGWGLPEYNRFAWLGSKSGFVPKSGYFKDLHSLYLHLPMTFGWIGAFFFLFFIIRTLFRIVSLQKRLHTAENNHFKGILLAIAGMWVAFLCNEYKINAMREPNYFLLIWIFLGFSHALVKTLETQFTHDCYYSRKIL